MLRKIKVGALVTAILMALDALGITLPIPRSVLDAILELFLDSGMAATLTTLGVQLSQLAVGVGAAYRVREKESNVRKLKLLPFLLALGALLGCDVTQTIEPSPVTVEISTTNPPPVSDPAPPPGAPRSPQAATIALVPPSAQLVVGQHVSVTILVRDADGTELSPKNVIITIANPAIVRRVETTDRTILFQALAAGSTSAAVSASGLTTSIPFVVT